MPELPEVETTKNGQKDFLPTGKSLKLKSLIPISDGLLIDQLNRRLKIRPLDLLLAGVNT